jgi:hypothetical protein
MDPPELESTVRDTAIEGLPAETPAGRDVVTVNVAAADGGVEFLQLSEGMTFDDFISAKASQLHHCPVRAGTDAGGRLSRAARHLHDAAVGTWTRLPASAKRRVTFSVPSRIPN